MLKKISTMILLFLFALTAASPSLAAAKSKAKPKAAPKTPAAQPAPARMYDLFWKRSWDEMGKLYAKGGATARDHALMANAYRFQNKWKEAVAILEAHARDFPASVRPYADMTLLLGYENLKRKKDALAVAERLWKSAPQDLKYYVALAQYRLVKDGGDNRQIEAALNRMLQSAGTQDRKINALSKLIGLGGNRTEAALKLLELQPSNKTAAVALSRHKTPWPANVRVALGVYAFLAGDNKAAAERLAPVALNAAGGRKAAYYRAWALSRLKRNKDALNLWGSLALKGNAYAESAVRRLAALAKDKGMKESCVAALERVAKERRGNVQARALLSLVDLLGKEQPKRKEAWDAQILQSFPNTAYSFNVLWRRGWANLNAGKPGEAAKLWKMADAPNVTAFRRARILYWLAHAQKAAGQGAEAEKTLALLTRKYPLSIYGLLTKPDVKIVDGDNPALALKPSELEQWGFIHYARLKLSRPKATARELYRALKLSRWLGLEESYSEARRLETLLSSGGTLYRGGLEALYPRPFKTQVEAAAKQYGVEDNFVWAIMRQESAFQPSAKSHAGASGLMQLMPGTAKDESKRAGLDKYDIMDVNDNIRLGTSHLNTLSKSFSRKEWIMAAYNAGGGNARKWMKDGGDRLALDRWIEAIRFDETCGYVQRVSANLEIYRRLYGREKKSEKKAD
ncbi:MAG: transglycosylase SLT domain-containing protein [Synergistaceae bacterium]|nr:transglycosylase SLT domain-containing protein [Synergistaceae bacterium]